MDKLKGALGGGSGGSSSSSGGGQDYVDKGLAAAEKKAGHEQSAETNEKATDKARDFVESKTGKDVPDSVSN